MTQVYHEENGLIFRKLEGETGISYISVPLEELKWTDTTKGLLVRHGNPFTGQCGYYPLSLLFVTPDKREEVAIRNQKRPPSEDWVKRTLDNLQCEGIPILH
jgi:hypothetical protein